MGRGIAVVGLNGTGKSTIAHALAVRMGLYEMDVEDYYFPAQRESRRRALNHIEQDDESDELPFSNPKSKNEVQRALLEEMDQHPDFVLACVALNWSDEILSRITLVFWIQTPLEERLKRIQQREAARFGTRILQGGDLFEQQRAFRQMVEKRDHFYVAESLKKLDCPVEIIDGTLTASELLKSIFLKLEI